MKITINSQTLARELRLLTQILAAKPAMPILGHVLIQAEGEHARMMTSNLEVGLSSECSANVIEPGALTLSAKKLLSLVEQFADDDVMIAADGAAVRITCGAFASRLLTLPIEEFPTPPTAPDGGVTLPLDVLQAMVRRVRFAVPEPGKPAPAGALLTARDGTVVLGATDSKRLAIASVGWAVSDEEIILPAKALDLLASLDGDQVVFSHDEHQLFFSAGRQTMFATQMAGKFPNYQRVIPKENTHIVTADRAALAAALRRVGSIAEDNFAVSMTLTAGAIELSSKSAGVGLADKTVTATYDGEALTVLVSWRAVLDFLEEASGQQATLALKDAATPMLMTDGDEYLCVVVLMR